MYEISLATIGAGLSILATMFGGSIFVVQIICKNLIYKAQIEIMKAINEQKDEINETTEGKITALRDKLSVEIKELHNRINNITK